VGKFRQQLAFVGTFLLKRKPSASLSDNKVW
jgi:hypothetical protein